ncbi:MAG: DegT/DnrJ/EryC1/StrS family aminotransferase [Pseudomonadales bacterium]|jgi:dTDP-4-amino-4,6-dideoxygalactose transaminase|nr:DegT/DnrJ/EryC1/StrS family aminotransferase [Pseudomonadales bacterium]
MRIFNTYGSEYDLAIAFATMLIDARSVHSTELKDFLDKTYGGKTYLTYQGREALLIGLKLLQLPKNSLVAVTGFTTAAMEKTLEKAGLKPVYLDIDDGLNFSSAELKKKLKDYPKIKAVIVQNTLGFPAQIQAIAKICKEKKIYLIEDLAQSLGTVYDDKTKAGRVGDLVTLSFGKNKVVDAVSGGALIVRSRVLRRKPLDEVLVQHDVKAPQQMRERFYPVWMLIIRTTYNIYLGRILDWLGNFELPTFFKAKTEMRFYALPHWQAGLAMNGLIDFQAMNDHRQKIVDVYMKNINASYLPMSKNFKNSALLRFYILVPTSSRDGLLAFLDKHNFTLYDTWYTAPVQAENGEKSTYELGSCPKSEEVCKQIINLPTHRNISEGQALALSQLINDYLSMSMREKENNS